MSCAVVFGEVAEGRGQSDSGYSTVSIAEHIM